MTSELDAAPATPVGPWRVLGTALALLGFLGGLAWLGFGLFSPPVDGAREAELIFGAATPPFGLTLDSAARLPTGVLLVRFAREDADEHGAGPLEALFLVFQSHETADALFRSESPPMGGAMGVGGPESEPDPGQRLKEWEKDKAFDWHFTMKRDQIGWGEWSTKYQIERSFRKDDGWYEEARVDLRTPGRPLVLLAHWPRETAVVERELRELLGAVIVSDLEAQ